MEFWCDLARINKNNYYVRIYHKPLLPSVNAEIL